MLAVHVVLCIARVPHSVFGRRWEAVAAYRADGSARYHLDTRFHGGAEFVEWIVDHVPEDAVVLYRGRQKGALEFVPALIHPRLLVSADHVDPHAATFAGRPIARRDGARIVIIGHGNRVEVEW